jgi:hypothetical protein
VHFPALHSITSLHCIGLKLSVRYQYKASHHLLIIMAFHAISFIIHFIIFSCEELYCGCFLSSDISSFLFSACSSF